ncbi:unnamed protein product [Amoebophrya sp. A25]|nr:unnamed protein product [Amoebophrya sp. A25]|eukprot:GSA25T00019670001.1
MVSGGVGDREGGLEAPAVAEPNMLINIVVEQDPPGGGLIKEEPASSGDVQNDPAIIAIVSSKSAVDVAPDDAKPGKDVAPPSTSPTTAATPGEAPPPANNGDGTATSKIKDTSAPGATPRKDEIQDNKDHLLPPVSLLEALDPDDTIKRRIQQQDKRMDQIRRQKTGVSSRAQIVAKPDDERASLIRARFGERAVQIRNQMAAVLNSQKFDMAVGLVIILNSVTIGWESQASVSGMESIAAFAVVEHIFLAIYCIEIILRVCVFGARCIIDSGWVCFDFVLVVVGVLSSWILPLVFTAGADELQTILVLRVLRLLRLARAVRLLVAFRTLWMLVRGLLTSMDTILYTFFLIFLAVYLAAVLGVELITKNRSSYTGEPELLAIIDDKFKDVFSTMLTLMTFVTLDSIGGIYIPLIKFQPGLFLYFISFLLIVSVALMNLVTAVLVQSAIEESENDKEVNAAYQKQQLAALMPEVRRIFKQLDEDGSGDISKQEVVRGLANNAQLKMDLEFFLGNHDPIDLFEMLDVDGGGVIAIDEFCDALLSRVTSSAPIELTRVLKLVTQIKADLQDHVRRASFQDAVGAIMHGTTTGGKDHSPLQSTPGSPSMFNGVLLQFPNRQSNSLTAIKGNRAREVPPEQETQETPLPRTSNRLSTVQVTDDTRMTASILPSVLPLFDRSTAAGKVEDGANTKVKSGNTKVEALQEYSGGGIAGLDTRLAAVEARLGRMEALLEKALAPRQA